MAKAQRVDQQRAPLVGTRNAEDRMIAITMAEMERRILSGKASDMLLVHFGKLGSTRAELETARIKQEMALMDARKTSIQLQSHSGDGYQNVIDAIKGYRGSAFDEELP